MMKNKNKNPFKVPPGYFDSLEQVLIDKTKNPQQLHGFTTPENYFGALEDEILSNLKNHKLFPSKNLRITLLGVATLAASLAIILSIFTKKNSLFVEINDQVFEEYNETYYLDNMDSFDILSMLEDNEIETLPTISIEP